MVKYEYTYNMLVREDNVWLDRTICYAYDAGGNMTFKKEYAYQPLTPGAILTGIHSGNVIDVWYKYNADGIRTSKTVNGVKTEYFLEGDKVIYEKSHSTDICYVYDNNDNVRLADASTP